MESLDRGVVAIHQPDHSAYVSWRVLGYEDPAVAFNVYRTVGRAEAVKLNDQPIADVGFFVDRGFDPARGAVYTVRPVIGGVEKSADGSFALPPDSTPKPYLSIPIQPPEGYHANDCSVGDLDGDGRYEIVVHMVGQGQDNSRSGVTTDPIFHAYTLEGELLWSINLGRNIREGAHYTQFMVYDFDGDGRAEIIMKTADGTTDGLGNVIGDANADYRNERGYIVTGPEFLTVFDGRTGKALDTVDYIPLRGIDTHSPTPDRMRELWGDNYGNRVDRFLAGVAYLDGERPSAVMARGYYTRTVLAAWDFRDGKLSHRWTFDSHDGNPDHRAYAGQGNHQLSVADVDADGRDEIIYGSAVINADGTGRYSTRLGHGDALHVSDLVPDRPGLEVFTPHEGVRGNGGIGASLRDASTGEVLWTLPATGDVGRGVALDIDPTHPGYEFWTAGGGTSGIYNTKGERIGETVHGETVNISRPACNFGIWWDGDLLREILDGARIYKWNWNESKPELTFDGAEHNVVSNNGTKANPALSADILGDWREELILRTDDSRELRIFVSSIPTEHRFYTLMHDPTYRLAIAWQNVSYNQPPHPGFFLGHGMSPAPLPRIRPAGATEIRTEVMP
jgi:rhamnogalacturonan endolyase